MEERKQTGASHLEVLKKHRKASETLARKKLEDVTADLSSYIETKSSTKLLEVDKPQPSYTIG